MDLHPPILQEGVEEVLLPLVEGAVVHLPLAGVVGEGLLLPLVEAVGVRLPLVEVAEAIR